jgi:ABC-type uncharacterized transport system permease subunit
MILPTAPVHTLGVAPLVLALVAVLAYAVAAWPARSLSRLPAPALVAGWLLHAVLLALDIGGWGRGEPGARLGFGPVLSLTVWLVLGVHEIESRFVPLPGVRRVLAINGAVVVLVAWAFPGEVRAASSVWAPVHWLLGVGSYALFGAAVLHAWMLDSAERQLRLRKAGGSGAFGLQPNGGGGGPISGMAPGPMGMPLLRLERLTFRFVEAGFIVLTGALVLGVATAAQWRWDHKTVFSLLGWTVFAGLLAGRQVRGWRGRRATRWLYAGAALLLLAYVGSRFVFEVLVGRPGA